MDNCITKLTQINISLNMGLMRYMWGNFQYKVNSNFVGHFRKTALQLIQALKSFGCEDNITELEIF